MVATPLKEGFAIESGLRSPEVQVKSACLFNSAQPADGHAAMQPSVAQQMTFKRVDPTHLTKLGSPYRVFETLVASSKQSD